MVRQSNRAVCAGVDVLDDSSESCSNNVTCQAVGILEITKKSKNVQCSYHSNVAADFINMCSRVLHGWSATRADAQTVVASFMLISAPLRRHITLYVRSISVKGVPWKHVNRLVIWFRLKFQEAVVIAEMSVQWNNDIWKFNEIVWKRLCHF